MSTQTGHQKRFSLADWVILVMLTLLSAGAGLWQVAGLAATYFSGLLFAPAFGLPALIPPLRFSPLGATTTTVWLIDLAGVLVMIFAAALWLRAASSRQPGAGRLRIFGRGIWVTIVAVVCGNVVRGVFQSFLLLSDLPTFAGQLLANIVHSALLALALGLLVGLVASLFCARSHRAFGAQTAI